MAQDPVKKLLEKIAKKATPILVKKAKVYRSGWAHATYVPKEVLGENKEIIKILLKLDNTHLLIIANPKLVEETPHNKDNAVNEEG